MTKLTKVEIPTRLAWFPMWLSLFLLFSFIGGCWANGCSGGYEQIGRHFGVMVRAAKDVITPP